MHRQAAAEASRETARARAEHDHDCAHEPGRLYDSFVVRVWREEGSDRIARAEVEHVQSASVRVAVGPEPAWVLRALTACLDEHSHAANELGTGSTGPAEARL